MTEIEEQVKIIADSGSLGRSPVYERLLSYLADKTADGKLPKEIDIALDVFDRSDFDPAKDSTVRVYLHNLRQKLDGYYTALPAYDGARIQIPKGEYRLELAPVEQPDGPEGRDITSRQWVLVGAAMLIAGLSFVVGRATAPASPILEDELARSPVWHSVVADSLPVTIVVGDYYVFADVDEDGISNRLIRDFTINDQPALEQYLDANPGLRDKYLDVQLSYLPLGIGSALEAVVRVLHSNNKTVRVIPQSQFRTQMLRGAHVIYVGYLSGMGRLARYPFAASRLAVGMSYDELIDTETGNSYVSRAGYITDNDVGYTDYGYFSTFPGPSGNQFLIVAGMRDEGLMRMAAILADSDDTLGMTDALAPGNSSPSSPLAFETLYEVKSLDRTYVTAKRLFVERIDASLIWEN